MLHPLIYWAILLAVVGYAFRRGRLDERIAALTCLVGTIATMLLSSDPHIKYSSVETGVLVVDVIGFMVFTGIALHSMRFWPLWVAGFQLSSTLAHFLRAFDADLMPKVYAAAERFWIYPIFLAILIGVSRCPRYARQQGEARPA